MTDGRACSPAPLQTVAASTADWDALRADRDAVVEEREALYVEWRALLAESSALRDQRERLSDECDRLRGVCDDLKAERDALRRGHQQVATRLNQALDTITHMERSRFWKLRLWWLRVRRLLPGA